MINLSLIHKGNDKKSIKVKCSDKLHINPLFNIALVSNLV